MVYRDILLDDLRRTSGVYRDYSHYADIERFLEQLQSVSRELVPDNSLVREFIG